jgi:hypothetical protein
LESLTILKTHRAGIGENVITPVSMTGIDVAYQGFETQPERIISSIPFERAGCM